MDLIATDKAIMLKFAFWAVNVTVMLNETVIGIAAEYVTFVLSPER